MGIPFTLLLITVVVVNLVDISGFIDTLKHWIWKWVFKGKKEYKDFDFRPFSCSYCMTHWVGLIYLLFVGWSLEAYALLLILCMLTPIIQDILMIVRDFISKIIETIYMWFDL